uniref:Uncharacterized protein n=1 Tax=Streptococcus pyogenes TaxID=1314 RepID=N0DX20_STRPY|nr:hypothetical protein [Streptococcus pyogenes]
MRIGISYTSEKEKEFVMTNLLKNFDRPEVTLSDLRLLGCQGEAIAYLDDGRQALIIPRFAIVQHKRMVNGNLIDIGEDSLRFHEIYTGIVSIKRKHFSVSERTKRDGEYCLVLTGRGYHRQRKE